MSKVLITGADGQLGQEIVEVFSDWEVIPTDFHNLDITDKATVLKSFEEKKPDWVIHCAAWTDVEGCAEDPDKAMLINGEGTKNIAQAAKNIGAKLVYISTNEVFDGKKSEPYIESDKTNPLNPYAISKLTGENSVQEILGHDGVVARTSWVYGPKGKSNFPLKILSAAENNPELKVVDDEFATPTYAPDLAKAIFELVQKNPSGIYHLVNEGYCSRYDWAVEVLKFKQTKVKVLPIKLKDFNRKSTPPLNGRLANTNAKEKDVVLPKWEESLSSYLASI